AEGETESFVGRVTGTLGKIGLLVGGAAAAIGGAVGGLVAKTGISFNDFQEQSVNAFTTMLGSAEEAQKFLQDLTSFAAKTPFELPGLVESSKLLLAFGFNAEQVIPMMTAIGDAVAGLGGGPEVMDGIVRALGQMQAKGKATAEEMMQLAERGVPAWQYLAEALGVSVSEAMDMVSDGAVDAQTAINAVIQGMQGDFSGLMEVQSRTWSGMLSTLKDTFTQFSGTVMAPVFERLKGGLSTVLEFVSRPEFMEFGKRLGEGIANGIDRVANLVQTVGVPAFQALVGAVREVVAGFQSGGGEGFFATLGGAIRSFVDTVQGAIPAVKQQLSDFFSALQGQEGESFGAKLGEGVKNTVDLIRNDVLPALKEFGNWFTSEGLPAIQNFANTVTPVIQPVFGFLKDNLPTIVPLLATFAGAFVGLQGATSVLGGLLGPLTQVFSILRGAMSITPLISGLVGVLGGPLTAAILGIAAIVAVAFMAWQNNWFGIRDIVNQVWGTVGPILGQIGGAIMGLVNQVISSWQRWASEVAPIAQQAWQNIQTVITTVASVVMTVVGAIASFIASHWSQIQAITSGVWNAISAVIMGVMGVIQNVIKLVLALIAGDWGAAWEALKGIVSSVFGAVVGVVDGILQALKGVITLALDGVKAVWSAVWGEIRDVAGRLLSEAKSKIVEGVEAIKGVFSGAATWLVEAGKDIVRGLIDGISSMIETAKQTARNLASGVKDAVFGFLGIKSPSEVMQEAGQAVGEGLIAGLEARLDAVVAAAQRV
ncbi:MAG: tape measure protein, partial [Dehalococcoidia bacterium]|nr:tape measure protein [Dehalococcoidia bacterium]